ncbi:4593_t:CDS:2 [Ambispora gerdemannii]|uniref:4593_t:CDS:1 n=1 Tax=Ambispora gerdemannii TaxID=144530 RepID=A0A9N9BZX8_9GLOM|nr:4593_t:CDS:2 [Ambispora gerdemannii]
MIFKHCLFVFTLFLLNSKYVALADCPTYFKVAQCTPCQTTRYQLTIPSVPGNLTSATTCDQPGRFKGFADAKYAKTPNAKYSAINTEFCNLDNPCPSNVSIKGYQQIQKDCTKEIASQDNSVFGLFYSYYYAVPDYQNLCLKSSSNSGSYVWRDIDDLEIEYIRRKRDPSNRTIIGDIYNLFPPTLKIYFRYKDSNSTLNDDVPDEILCSEDYLKITDIYDRYIAENRRRNQQTATDNNILQPQSQPQSNTVLYHNLPQTVNQHTATTQVLFDHNLSQIANQHTATTQVPSNHNYAYNDPSYASNLAFKPLLT